MDKITYEQYRAMLIDPDSPDEKIVEYSKVVPGKSAFGPELVPDPEKVVMSEDEIEAENAMRIGNGLARWRRNRRVQRALRGNDPRPLLVAEGDSWFQFPLLIKEVVSQLGDDYLVWCVSAAGDTAQNMVFGAPEYMDALRRHNAGGRVAGFLFSAAGNDIIGQDEIASDPTPALIKILKRPAEAGSTAPADYIDMSVLGERLAFLRKAYMKVITDIRNDTAFKTLPIFIHGYDVPFPHPWEGDNRNPRWAAKDQWLGSAFSHHGITGANLQREILKLMIDALHDMFDKLARDHTGVHIVDCRGAMPSVTDWADEIHGTSDGFAKVAQRFKKAIEAAIPAQADPLNA